jgi:hypothetical protein
MQIVLSPDYGGHGATLLVQALNDTGSNIMTPFSTKPYAWDSNPMGFLHNCFKSIRWTEWYCESLLLFWPGSVAITDLHFLSGLQRMSSFGISLGRKLGCPFPTSAINYISALPQDSRICTGTDQNSSLTNSSFSSLTASPALNL